MGDVRDLIATAEKYPPAPPLAELTMPPDLVGYEDEEDPVVKGAWRIENTGSADWALRRLAECEAEIGEIQAQAEAAIARVRARAEELGQRMANGVGFFRFKLAEYAERNRGELLHGKKKSRDFLHGRIGWRKKAERLTVADSAALEEWLLAQPVESGLYRMRIEADKKALNEFFKREGVIPPGCVVEPESESLTIEAVAPERALTEGR